MISLDPVSPDTSSKRRVLVTGVASLWGGRVAQRLEADPDVDVVVGLDVDEPIVELRRTDFVKADESYSILARLVKATGVDTILHMFMIVDSTSTSAPRLHEVNVIGTLNLLAAAGAPDSAVRRVVVKSSTLVYGSGARDPSWFSEATSRTSPARTAVERSLIEAESYLRDYSADNTSTALSILRFANVVGPDIAAPLSKALSGPLIPKVGGFDPQIQLIDQTDVVAAVDFARKRGLKGTYNVAAGEKLPWSEMASIMGKPMVALPPIGTSMAARAFGLLSRAALPPEMLDLLRYGRGVDTTKFSRAGFEYGFSTPATIDRFARYLRVDQLKSDGYRYEAGVERFFRESPSARAENSSR